MLSCFPQSATGNDDNESWLSESCPDRLGKELLTPKNLLMLTGQKAGYFFQALETWKGWEIIGCGQRIQNPLLLFIRLRSRRRRRARMPTRSKRLLGSLARQLGEQFIDALAFGPA